MNYIEYVISLEERIDELKAEIEKLEAENELLKYSLNDQSKDKMTYITHQLIESGSNNGGYNAKQINALGLKYPPKKGWKKDCIGKPITKENANRFIKLKGKSRNKK